MKFSRFALVLGLVVAAQSRLSWSQDSPKPPMTAAAIDNDFVQKEFGSTCSLLGTPPLAADLNGDGIQDVVIVARCKNPMEDQTENNFTVIDPYYSFFGYGDPKVSTQFSTEAPDRRGISLLVIHGSGPEAWRSATPLAKFLIVNLPFKQVAVKKIMLRKKKVMAIYVEETGADQMVSALVWDGNKYRYQPMGASME
jgi:hypothetical protein